VKQDWLYKYISVVPPWIIMLYLYTKNTDLISAAHVLLITIIFSALSFLFYYVVFCIEKFSPPPPPPYYPQCKKTLFS
jgi:ATP/ADP translocase